MKEKFKQAVSSYLNISDDEVFLFWKGRVALYAILKSIGIKEGDEVILPAFTCVVVPNAIIYLKAKPVYVDIDPDTYNIDVNKIENLITSKTKVIIAQNTFGLAPDLDRIIEIAARHKLLVVEDCAHGFGGTYRDKQNGLVADVSFYSTQWNKPFSTGIGGIAVSTNEGIRTKLKAFEAKAVVPSIKDELILKALIFVKEYFLNAKRYWYGVKLYRFLSKRNLIIGSSQGHEMEKPDLPDNFLKGFSNTQARKGVKALKKLKEVNATRRRTAFAFHNFLKELNIKTPYEPNYAEHTFLKYPILVHNREEFLNKAEKAHISLGEWFNSPIHPIQSDFHLWQYKLTNPIAENISKYIVNLPTEDFSQVEEIKKFLLDNKEHLMVQ